MFMWCFCKNSKKCVNVLCRNLLLMEEWMETTMVVGDIALVLMMEYSQKMKGVKEWLNRMLLKTNLLMHMTLNLLMHVVKLNQMGWKPRVLVLKNKGQPMG